jgi:hypothetical protein
VKIEQNNGDFTAKEYRTVMKCLFLKENSAKKIYDDMSVTLGKISPLPNPQSRTGLLGLQQDI